MSYEPVVEELVALIRTHKWEAAFEEAVTRAHNSGVVEMRDVKTSVALYSVSSDVDGARIVQQMSARSDKAIAAMFASSRTPITRDPHLVANMLQSAISGVSRRLLESPDPEKHFDSMFQELLVFVCAYLDACSAKNESSS